VVNKKINLAFFSNTRSEFGLINQILREIKKNKKFKYEIFLSGTHFSKQYGNSISEIKSKYINYQKIFEYNTQNSREKDIIENISLNSIKLSKKFSKIFQNIDYVILFGDRIDLIPIMLNCVIYNKKIIHFGGGEETKGSIDNKIRKIISSVSNFHFVSANKYKNNLIKFGISKKNIFVVGTLSVEKKMKFNQKSLFLKNIKNKNLVSLTYHPTILKNSITEINQIKIILNALEKFKEKIFVIINSPGYEKNSEKIIKFLEKWTIGKKNYRFCRSLGISNYTNLIKKSKFIIGNSSSGVIMAPFFNIPSINIGNRQEGRLLHNTVINCELNESKIIFEIKKILENKKKIKKVKFLLGDGNAAKKSMKILNRILSKQ
tara:strand:- start:612 stop:1739 length:1128 start_codon:yes stop_codon:yes gene_type:complete